MSEKIIVAGGAGGIGSAIVDKYVSIGANVVVMDRKPITRTDSARQNKVHAVHVDVTRWDSIEQAVKESSSIEGELSHIISLAGHALADEFGTFSDTSLETIENSLLLNLQSHLYLTKAVLPLLKSSTASNRSIVYVSSINAVKDFGLAAYSSAKAGIIGLVHGLCTELGRSACRVNAVLPGTVRTPHTEGEPKDFDSLLKTTALGRFATTHDIAAVVHAVTHAMTCVTGQAIISDCGQVVRGQA